MSEEQRRAPRYDVHLVVRYASAAEFVADYVENLSENGLFVANAAELPIGHECDVELVLPGQGTWTVRARVVFKLPATVAQQTTRSSGAGMEMISKPEGFDDALLGYLLRLGRRRDFTVIVSSVPGDKAIERSGYRVTPFVDPATVARMAEENPQLALVVPEAEADHYRTLLPAFAERIFGVAKAVDIPDVIARIDSLL